MRFAGDIEYKVTDNDQITKALADFTAKVIESLPTSDQRTWNLRLMFDAES